MLTPPDNAALIHDEERIASALDAMALGIDCLFDSDPVVMITVLNGGLNTAAGLAQRVNLDLRYDYLHATRYRGETNGGALLWHARPRTPLADEQVLVVDDILDEGITLQAILETLSAQEPRSIKVAVLCEKRHDRRDPSIVADVVGLTVPDQYVFGFGMDYHERYRQLSAIYAI